MKEHLGPHGKGRCVIGTLTGLQERVEKLEATITENEAQHKRELADQAALFATHVEGLVALIDSLSNSSGLETVCRPPGVEGSSVHVASLAGLDSEASLASPDCTVTRAAVDAPLSSLLPVNLSSCSSGSGEASNGCEASDARKGQLKFHGEGVNSNLVAPACWRCISEWFY